MSSVKLKLKKDFVLFVVRHYAQEIKYVVQKNVLIFGIQEIFHQRTS